jgi:hypothetical protein
LVVVDKLNSADFLKWKSLYFGGIDFKLEPMAVNISEIALTDFYSRLILNKEGKLNVADIVKKPGERGPGQGAQGRSRLTPAPRARSRPRKRLRRRGQSRWPEGKPALPIKIAKITLQAATVNFSDFFRQAELHGQPDPAGGRVTGLSSAADTVADMELRGKYANSAPVEISRPN